MTQNGTYIFFALLWIFEMTKRQGMTIFRKIWMCSAISSILATSAYAQAQDKNPPPAHPQDSSIAPACYALDENTDWRELFNEFTRAYQAKDYEAALNATQKLSKICDHSPILNYSMAQTYYQIGKNDEALTHINLAITNARTFSIPEEIEKRLLQIRSEIESARKMAKQKALIDDIQLQASDTAQKLQEQQKISSDLVRQDSRRAEIVMWTGTGVGIAGLLSLIAGATLVATSENHKTVPYSNPSPNETVEVSFNGYRSAGLITLGIGIGATIVGTVMAGIGGYFYTHPLDDGRELAFSYDLSPQHIQFGMTF